MEHQTFEDRSSYEARQIEASRNKFKYCKFSCRDAEKYVSIVRADKRDRGDQTPIGPVLCLGVRGGREVDLFRTVLRGSRLRRGLARRLERRRQGMNARLPWIESAGRSDYSDLGPHSCVGVEINPLARRSDILIGSYDDLPAQWEGTFGVVFSNSFDHAYDPIQVAQTWRRVIRPGGYLVLDFPEQQRAAAIDPVGLLTLADVLELFPGSLVYFHRRGSVWSYTEFVVRLP